MTEGPRLGTPGPVTPGRADLTHGQNGLHFRVSVVSIYYVCTRARHGAVHLL